MRDWNRFPQINQVSLRTVFSIVLVVIVLVLVFSSFYLVGPAEVGVIKRFGKISGVYGPGMHWKIPIVDKLIKVDVAAIRRLEIGFRSIGSGANVKYRDVPEEALLLTKDGKIVDLDFVVQYQIAEPIKFISYVREAEKLPKDLAQASMRQVVGDFLFDEILTISKGEIQDRVKMVLQDLLDEINFGVKVVNVQLQDVVPPDPVQPAFQEVINAKSEKDKLILEAQSYYNQIVPEAEGEAAKIIADAEAYKNEQIEKSKGDAYRYKTLLDKYKKAPSLIRTKLYIEALEIILPETKIILLDDPKGSMKIFNLPQEIFTNTLTLPEGSEGK